MSKGVYKVFITLCILSFFCSGVGIGITFNKRNKKDYIEYIDNVYYITNYNSRTYNEREITQISSKEKINSKIEIEKLSIERTNNNSESNNIEIYNIFDLTNNENEYLQIYAKNKNNLSVKANFKLLFYDKNNRLIDTILNTEYILPNVEFAVNFKIKNNNYYYYKLEYDASNVDNNIVSIDYIDKYNSFVVKENSGELNILFKNNTVNDIDVLKYSCILYKNNKAVAAFLSKNSVRLPVKYGEGLKCGLESFDGLNYDSYKIYLTEAYNFQTNN